MTPGKYASKLANKRVLVLGGTSGLGFCVAEASVEYRAIVTIASSTQSKLEQAISRIQSSYPENKSNISGQVCDLLSEDVEANLTALLDFATNNGKDKLDHIVNTAGDAFKLTKLGDVTVEDVQRHGKVRYIGSMMLAKLVANHGYMHNNAGSSITLTSGANGAKPSPGWSTLVGWSGAMENMTKGLAVDLKPIRVNCVSPGAVRTELFSRFGDEKAVDRVVEMFKGKTLTGEIGHPEDVAEAYLYCMKDRFVTGTRLDTNGGYLLV